MHSLAPSLSAEKMKYILYIGQEPDGLQQLLEAQKLPCLFYKDPFLAYAEGLAGIYAKKPLPYAIICREDFPQEEAYTFVRNLKKCSKFAAIPCILYNPSEAAPSLQKAKETGADDFYHGAFPLSDLLERLDFLHQTKPIHFTEETAPEIQPKLRVSVGKRLFDILFSFLALLVLSPLLLLLALLIKLESGGPVLYVSKRVGTAYRVFDFYKFRTMRIDADKMIQDLLHLNQYQSVSNPTFFKINKDPRVTRMGRFLRNTSLDELPQLINVLKGNMSIVGNRPLPLYEAERITKDQWSKRFLAPAGITGLWQVSRRGNKEMSAEERIALDMAYADESSLWYDLKIVAQTIPALLQKESV